MKYKKSHFWYNKSQRNGIFFLAFIIVVLQFIFFYVEFPTEEIPKISSEELKIFQKETDSLQKIKKEKKSFKMYHFNPNYITDYKGYVLGMKTEELDKLFQFRKKGKFVNSSAEFQKVTGISDSLLQRIAPFFKFPKWVTQQKKKYTAKKLPFKEKDINIATAQELQFISGIGEKLSERIVNYRKKLQGFSDDSQLYEVWGLDKEVVGRLLKVFKVKTKPNIQKINVNTATFKEVLHIVYIDYKLCKKIFEYRDEVAELQSIEELKNIEGFPLEKFKKITLYLEAK